MQIRITSYLGKEGFAENFMAEGGGQSWLVRWAPQPERDGDERYARVKDAGLLLRLNPDPLVAEVHAVLPAFGGVAVVSDPPLGLRLSEFPQPVPEPVILEVIRQVAGLLDRFYNLSDPATGRTMQVLHRNISAEHIRLSPTGDLQVSGFDEMRLSWAQRAAETSMMSLQPGSRLAPEQMSGAAGHTTDVYLLGLVAIDLLVDSQRASRFARSLAMCICDPEGFVEIRESLLDSSLLAMSAEFKDLLRTMLQEEPTLRPTAREVSEKAAGIGASQHALRAFAARLPSPIGTEPHEHDFLEQTLEIAIAREEGFPTLIPGDMGFDAGNLDVPMPSWDPRPQTVPGLGHGHLPPFPEALPSRPNMEDGAPVGPVAPTPTRSRVKFFRPEETPQPDEVSFAPDHQAIPVSPLPEPPPSDEPTILPSAEETVDPPGLSDLAPVDPYVDQPPSTSSSMEPGDIAPAAWGETESPEDEPQPVAPKSRRWIVFGIVAVVILGLVGLAALIGVVAVVGGLL